MNFASIRQTVASSITGAANWIETKAIPATLEVANKTVAEVDNGANTVNTGFVKFLLNHPGISMTLSAGTVIKAVAAHHVDRIIQQQESAYIAPSSSARVATLYSANTDSLAS